MAVVSQPTQKMQIIQASDLVDSPISLKSIAIAAELGTSDTNRGWIPITVEVIVATGSIAQIAYNEACSAAHPLRAAGYRSPVIYINPGVDTLHFKGAVGDQIVIYW